MTTIASEIAAETRSFDLEAGNARATLREFARQASVSVVMDRQNIQGVQTNKVFGVFTPKHALERMLDGTSLAFNEDLETGAFAVTQSEVSVAEIATKDPEVQTPELENKQEIEMNEKNRTNRGLFKGLLAVALASSPNLSGQDDLNDGNDEVFELSPFTVDASEDTGYRATTTIAGTRIKTQLRDIASSISVYTEEFIEDTGSTDITDLLVYAVGVEVDGMNGNFTSAVGSGNFDTVDFSAQALQNQTSTRVRGLDDADRTRNFFGSIVPIDAYNVDRVVINRGANNILFGLGSPAGIINQSLAQPMAEDSNEFKVRTDDSGSIRGSFDVNRVFAEDKVRLRLIGLHNDQRYQQESAYRKEQRIYGAVDFNLTKNTKLKINGEVGDMNSAPAVNGPPNDRFTNWWKPDVGQPTIPIGQDFRDRDFLGIDGTTLPGGNDNQVFFDGSTPVFGVRPIRIAPIPEADLDLASYDALNPARQNTFRPMFTSHNTEARRIRLRPTRAGLPGFEDVVATLEDSFVQSDQIHDTSVFDYRNDTIAGRNNIMWHDIEAFNISLQQTFFEGNAGIELSYDSQKFDSGFFNLLAGGFRTTVSLDVNEGYPDGSPNPNFGRAFLPSRSSFSQNEESRESQRAVFYFNLDAEEHLDGIGKWLGQHSFTGLFEKSNKRQRGYSGPGFALEDRWGSTIGMNPNAIQYDGGLRLGTAQYLDASVDSFIGVSGPEGANLRLPSNTLQYPSSINMVYVDPVDRSFTSGDFSVLNWRDNQAALTTGSFMNELEVQSVAIALQSRFLSDNLITTIGWRDDQDDRWVANSLSGTTFENTLGTHDLSGLAIDDSNLFAGEGDQTVSWGAVFHVPDSLLSRDSGVGLSFHYNESENFNPNVRVRKPIADRFGEEFGAPNGDSTDFGATISLLDGKLVAKGTWYETNQKQTADTGPGGPYGWYFVNLPQAIYQWNTTAEIQASGFDAALPSEGVQTAYNYRFMPDPDRPEFTLLEIDGIGAGDISQTVSEGFELELIYNPNANLRLFMNAAKQKAVRTGIAQTGGAEMERLFSLWNTPEILGLWRVERDSGIDANNSFADFRIIQQIAELRSLVTQNGQKSDALRDWRFNMGGMYSFDDDSSLKGWAVGGALRWQDKPTIGYPIIDDPELGALRDISNPVFGSSEAQIDFWLRHRRMIFDDKVDWTMQLNIRNLTDEDDLVDAFLNYAGLPNIVRFNEGRRFILSSTFGF